MESSPLAKKEEPPDDVGETNVSGEDPFAVMVAEQERKVFQFFYRRLADRSRAPDLTQEVFIKAWQKKHTFDSSRPVWPWLQAIAHNELVDYVRKQKAQKRDSSARAHSSSDLLRHGLTTADGHVCLDPTPEPDQISSLSEQKLVVREALEQLSESDYTLVSQRYYDNMTPTEIAALNGKSPQAVNSALHRARERIELLLQRKGLIETHTPATPSRAGGKDNA